MYQKTAWLAIFYMCIPSGYALGYVYGGLVSLHPVFLPLLHTNSNTCGAGLVERYNTN